MYMATCREDVCAVYCPACEHLQQPAEKCRNENCGADIRGVRSPLHGFRFHDCRHRSITRLCETQANDSIIREIAGHVSSKMLAHYSHLRMSAKRKALDSLSVKPSEAFRGDGRSEDGYDTNHDTNPRRESTVQPQV